MSMDVHNQEHNRQTPLMENANIMKQSAQNGAHSPDNNMESSKT